jgi:hypothetical protein
MTANLTLKTNKKKKEEEHSMDERGSNEEVSG